MAGVAEADAFATGQNDELVQNLSMFPVDLLARAAEIAQNRTDNGLEFQVVGDGVVVKRRRISGMYHKKIVECTATWVIDTSEPASSPSSASASGV